MFGPLGCRSWGRLQAAGNLGRLAHSGSFAFSAFCFCFTSDNSRLKRHHGTRFRSIANRGHAAAVPPGAEAPCMPGEEASRMPVTRRLAEHACLGSKQANLHIVQRCGWPKSHDMCHLLIGSQGDHHPCCLHAAGSPLPSGRPSHVWLSHAHNRHRRECPWSHDGFELPNSSIYRMHWSLRSPRFAVVAYDFWLQASHYA